MIRTTWTGWLAIGAIALATASDGAPQAASARKASPGQTYLCGGKRLTAAQIAARLQITPDLLRLLLEKRGLTPEAACALPKERLRETILKAKTPGQDQPDQALLQRLGDLRDENGVIRPNGLVEAKRHVDLMRAESLRQSGGAAPPPTAGVTPGGWTWLGPGNVGGRVRTILVHPTTPTTVFLGSVSGGIWKSTNSGGTWSPVDDFMANLAVTSLVMHPTGHDVMFAGTGEGFLNADSIQGAGIFKSTNGGTNWAQLASTANASFDFVNRLAISPNGGTLLAATGNGIWRSTDAGASWTQVHATRTLDVDFHPTDSQKAVAGRGDAKTLYSTDGGASWTLSTVPGANFIFPEGRVETAYAPGAPTTVYASVDDNGGRLWKSTDGGVAYTQVNSSATPLDFQGWYDNALWVSPTDENLVMWGGVEMHRSTDGGANFSTFGASDLHVDHHAIVHDPGYNGTTNKKVYFGSDGGIFRADDVTAAPAVTVLNNSLGITQFYGAAGNDSNGTVIGGTQDNGTQRYTTAGGTNGWTSMNGGDGAYAAADQTDPNYYYGSYQWLQIHRSSNGGVSSTVITSGLLDANFQSQSCGSRGSLFIAPFIMDPNSATTLLAGGCSLWRTTNPRSGTVWASIKPVAPANSVISAIAVAVGDSDIVWVGHNNGNVYKTTNGTAASPTWTQMDANPTALPNRRVMRIAIDPADANVVYVTFGGFNGDNVYRSTDGGATWADRTGSGLTGLPDIPIRTLVVHPDNSDWIYAGGESGIFTSEDAGATWHVPHDGPANVSVDELFIMGNATRDLVAATHGRGIYKHAAAGPFVTIGFTAASQAVAESGTATAQVRVTTSDGNPLAAAVQVDYATLAGTAASPADYTAINGTLMFPAGTANNATQDLPVPIAADTLDEVDEAFAINLTAPSGSGAMLGTAQHMVTITDDDATPSLTIGDVAVSEGNTGTATASFTVTLSAASSHTVTVNYLTANNTAVASVASESTTNAAAITIGSSVVPEAASPYPSNITISGVTGNIYNVTARLNGFGHTFPADVDVLLVGPGGQKVILLSDAGASLDVTGLNLTFEDGASPAPVHLTTGTYGPTNLPPNDVFPAPAPAGPYGSALSVFNGNGANGTWSLYVVDDAPVDVGSITGGWTLTLSLQSGDYNGAAGVLTFNPGETSKDITVGINGDTTTELNETYFVNLSSPANATLADSQGVGTIDNDDGAALPPLDDDLNGSGTSDVLWRQKVNGDAYAFLMTGNVISGQGLLGNVGTAWKIVGRGQFDAGGKSDVVWHNSATGTVYLWKMDGLTVASEEFVVTVADLDWEIGGTSDHDRDGKADILWRNKVTGAVYLWRMNGSSVLAQEPVGTLADTNWEVAGTGDHDGDGKADILWRNKLTGAVYLWRMNGAAVLAQEFVTTVADLDWEIAGTSDHDGGGKADILWRKKTTGDVYLYRQNGAATVAQQYVTTVGNTDWEIVGTGDYDGDGKADSLWRNKATGAVYVFRMNGATVVAQQYVTTAEDTNWEIANPR